MTIVAIEDTRNGEWKKDNKGSALLKKMGWSEGTGLGKRRQGSAVALRAVKRADSLGIGASTDMQGTSGWEATNNSFVSVLEGLKQHHGGDCSSSETDGKKKKKKRKTQTKKKDLVLARNKVTAGHARKMRESKCLKSKSDHDMAAIFGTKLRNNEKPESNTDAKKDSDKRETKKRKKSDSR